jgi:hypothetical protein
VCFAVVLAGVLPPASALATMVRSKHGHPPASTVEFEDFSDGSERVRVSTDRGAIEAGEFAGSLDGRSFLSFCVDLFQTLRFGKTYTDYSKESASAYFGSAKAEDIGRLATGYLGLVDDPITSAAFQLALWEIINESSGRYDLRKGSFKASGRSARESISLADSWLANLPATSSYSAEVLASRAHQDVVIFSAQYTPSASPVPVPGTPALFLAGLLGLFAAVQRRAKRDAR